MDNLTLLLNLRETTSKYLIVNSEKIDNFTKSVKNQLETMDMGLKTYLKTMLEISSRTNKLEFENFETKISSAKMENHRYAIDLKNLAIDLKAENEQVQVIKSDIINKIEISTRNNDEFLSN